MELYATGRGHRPTYVAVFMCFTSVILNLASAAPSVFQHRISDECDWFGSGLENLQRKSFGVQPVYLRCREGIVEWQYPRGALRIILRMGQSGKEFRGCLKVDPSSSGATLYQEEPKRLKYLYGITEENEVNSKQICFKSTGGQIALFLEAQGPHNMMKDVFRLMYDLEPIKEKGYSECRPCTKRELLYLFCTSDFVARGFISSLNQNELTQQTEMTIHSHEVLRDSEHRVFNQRVVNGNNETYSIGLINRPLHCGTRAGSGEFLIIGRWRLGTPILSCAPRWTEWEKIKQEALDSENLDCILE